MPPTSRRTEPKTGPAEPNAAEPNPGDDNAGATTDDSPAVGPGETKEDPGTDGDRPAVGPSETKERGIPRAPEPGPERPDPVKDKPVRRLGGTHQGLISEHGGGAAGFYIEGDEDTATDLRSVVAAHGISVVEIQHNVWEKFPIPNTRETGRRLLYHKGQMVALAEIEAVQGAADRRAESTR
jgi:hypothetical protein